MHNGPYPRLTDHAHVKGVKGAFRISDYHSDRHFPISDFQAQLLNDCNGFNSLPTLSQKYNLTETALSSFLEEFNLRNLLIFENNPVNNLNLRNIDLGIESPWLEEVQLDLSYLCNLSCRHCLQTEFNEGISPSQEIGKEKWFNIIDQASEMNVLRINISGGEPLIYKHFMDVVRYIESKDLLFSVLFTNGTLMPDWFEKFLRQTPYNTLLYISLDGATANGHDYLRGAGTFGRVIKTLEALRNLKEKGARFQYGVNSTIHKGCQHEIAELYKLMSDLGVPIWKVSVAREEGSFMNNYEDLCPDLEVVFPQYRQILDDYIATYMFNRKQQIIKHLTVEGFFKTTYLDMKIWNIACSDSRCCEYKKGMLCVKPNGDVVSCTAFGSYVIGNLKDTPLKEVWYSSRARFIKDLPVSYVSECQGCRHMDICGTGCRAIVHARSGNLKGKHHLACNLAYFASENILPLLKQAGVEFRPFLS